MIARIWRAEATAELAPTYQHHFADKVIPHLKEIPGYAGASLLCREVAGGVEIVAMTLWETLDSIRGFTGPDPDKAVVDPKAQTLLKTFDAVASNYEVAVSG